MKRLSLATPVGRAPALLDNPRRTAASTLLRLRDPLSRSNLEIL
jgi:hypothetical protein